MKRTLLLTAMIGVWMQLAAQKFSSTYELVNRRVPWLKNHISLVSSPKTKEGKDEFSLLTRNHKLIIAASSASASTKALGYYLKKYCNRSMSHLGDNLSFPGRIPEVRQRETVISNVDVRYALNYCTLSYSMAFYDWTQWDHELDWMALNGVNLMLAPIGTEKVWQMVLKRYGFTDEEILKFLPGPAFEAWWLMGNLEGWGGPLSQPLIDQQSSLAKKIIDRMKGLGIEPVFQGFYGMVPATLKEKYKTWKIVEQGTWAGDFRRPDILLPTDPHFAEVADVYYSTVKELYGDNIHYFGGEPFHEGGITKGIDVTACAVAIQKSMLKNVPNSTWMLQGWQQNPTDRLLGSLDKRHVVIEELFGENTDNWYRRKGYNQTPFIWCTVTNFGEKQGLYGKLQRFSDEVYRARSSEYAGSMRGIGIMPEGINNNPVVYEFVLDLAWQSDKTDTRSWIADYVKSRYGVSSNELQAAWDRLLKTVYSSPKELQEGPQESVFCARPSLNVKSASSWGTRRRNYDTDLFAQGVRDFVAGGTRTENETYHTDKIDFVRQLLANKGEKWYAEMVSAFNKQDSVAFKIASGKFLKGILQQDSLLSASPYFQLFHWLHQAEVFAPERKDIALCLKNLKAQITYWGPDTNASTNLHDYSNKEWNGMMRYFYYPRWEMFIKTCMEKLEGKAPADPDYYSFEVQWAQGSSLYPPVKLSPLQEKSLIHRILSEQ